jgi:hypothetical protein
MRQKPSVQGERFIALGWCKSRILPTTIECYGAVLFPLGWVAAIKNRQEARNGAARQVLGALGTT